MVKADPVFFLFGITSIHLRRHLHLSTTLPVTTILVRLLMFMRC